MRCNAFAVSIYTLSVACLGPVVDWSLVWYDMTSMTALPQSPYPAFVSLLPLSLFLVRLKYMHKNI